MRLIRSGDGSEHRGWPGYLFWGRMRTSTFVLIVAFMGTWWLYETYKPAPEPAVTPETQMVPPGFVPDPGYTWVPRTNVQTATPTTTPPTTTTTVTTTPETTLWTPNEGTPTAPGGTPTPGPPTTPTVLPPGPEPTPATAPTVPTPLTPDTGAENRSGGPMPNTTVVVPAPGNGDRP